jgi:hypothetical protein
MKARFLACWRCSSCWWLLASAQARSARGASPLVPPAPDSRRQLMADKTFSPADMKGQVWMLNVCFRACL